MHLPHPTLEDFVRAAIGRLQSSERVAERLRKASADPKEYFTTLFERAKELVASAAEPNGFNPRTVAAGSVYLASLAMRPKTFTQREAGEALGIKEVHRPGVLLPEAERGVRDARGTAGSAR